MTETTPHPPQSPSQTKQTLRVGFVGAGAIAGTHARHYQARPDVEMVAAADVAAGNLDQLRSEFGVTGLYNDWRQMLEKENLDAVSICTPNHLHHEPTIDALNAGCHVLVEKPLAMNAEQGREMLELAKSKGLVLTTGFQFRYEPSTQMIKRAYENGTLGEVMAAKVHAVRRRGIPNWGVFGRKDLQGGGALIDIGVHAMEMTHYCMGSPRPVAASAGAWTYLGNQPSDVVSMWPNWDHENYTVEDLAVGQVRFDNGAVMQVEAMFAGHVGPEQEGMKFELIGTKGGATKQPPALYYDKDGTMINASPGFLPKDNKWERKMNNFVDAALHGAEDESPGEHGLLIQQIIDALYKSAETGREVEIR